MTGKEYQKPHQYKKENAMNSLTLEQKIAQTKAMYHRKAQTLTWEEKVASIERMREFRTITKNSTIFLGKKVSK